ncbi:MAG: hypothetical protein H6974_09495 [Gammaproteobacteria bacterium]|nr:hypothetical protein [Gammaproteobacteria bacterium]
MDLLTDCSVLLHQQGVAPTVIQQVIGELRQRYGGDRPFIRKIDRFQRDQAIAEDLSHGLPLETIARRWKCSRNTVRKVRDEWAL